MKKILSTLLVILSLQSTAQVYVGTSLHEGLEKRAYSLLTNQESKAIVADLEKYLAQFGKLTKPGKNVFRVQNIKGNTVSTDLNYIDVITKSTKSITKLEFFFLNDAHNALNDYEINPGGPEKFVQEFIDIIQNNLNNLLITENIALAEEENREAKKELAKIEKAISSNLKEQQKLGKKLDASPDAMAQAMAEKEELLEQITKDSSLVMDEKAKGEIQKASQKKEKEINKIKKEAQKAEGRLEKKEAELENLKRVLTELKRRVKATEKIVADARSWTVPSRNK